MRFSSPGKDFSFYAHCNTGDGGTLLIGRLFSMLDSSSSLTVIKLNATGQVVWNYDYGASSGRINISRILEQSNGEIAVSGYLMNNGLTDIVLLKLTPTGNITWCKKYYLNGFDNYDERHPYCVSEGANSDLLFTFRGEHLGNSGTTPEDSAYAVITWVNSFGTVVWSKAFVRKNDNYIHPSYISKNNSFVTVAGYRDDIAEGYGNASTFAMQLDYTTGGLTQVKSYKHNVVTSNGSNVFARPEIDEYNSVRLGNGFALFGRFAALTDKKHAYKIVFDEQLNLIKATRFDISRTISEALGRLFVLQDGTVHFYGVSGVNRNLYWALLDSTNQISRQRKLPFAQGVGLLNFNYRNKEVYNFSTNYGLNNQRYALFTQLQRNDPSLDSCLGSDTSFVAAQPLNFSPSTFAWDRIINDPLLSLPLSLTQSGFSIETENLCTQISRCDSLRIFAPDTICVTNNFVNFTGLKNPDCHKRVLWEMNSSLIDSSYQPNDSTFSVRFKPIQAATPQTLMLYASAANCTIAKDTAQIVLLPGLNALPPDTVVCGSVNIRLTPGKWGRNYLWQNGSTDSVFSATDTGTYYVRAETVCGTLFSDTIHITRPFLSLGADKTICRNDTVSLHATPGFINYRWQQAGGNIMAGDSLFKVSPLSSVQYIGSAQTANGCFVSDTITITVLQPPSINLGSDTTFCSGDSLELSAPLSFASYLWSNNQTTTAITIKNSGTYWVKAKDSNGCSSSDTINIFPLYSKPIVTLAPKGVVCIGQTDTLHASGNFIFYEWQDGTANNFLPVTRTGNYWVSVIDANGCEASDTAVITKLVIPPKDFLIGDTIICAGISIELAPLKSFTDYLWGNGASTSSIEIVNAGLYVLQVKNGDNCFGKDSILVTTKNCPNRILFPSAFTPNGDGKNEIFKPFVQGRLMSYQFTVYNRWGQVVFTTTDHRKGWSGYLGDALQGTGTFVWFCQYQFSGEDKKMVKGSVMLIR